MTTFHVYVGNTNLVEIRGLKNVATDAFINDATVEVTVKDSDNANVSGQNWPTTMDYVASSDGIYRGILEDDIALVDGEQFTAVIDADGGADGVGHWEFIFTPKIRRSA